MPNPSLLLACARSIGDFGGKVVLSLAASAVAAAILAATPRSPAAQSPEASAPRWTSPIAADGKIRERHHDAVSERVSADRAAVAGLVTPAAVAMPMSLAWPVGRLEDAPQQQAMAAAPAAIARKAASAPGRTKDVQMAAVATLPSAQPTARFAQNTQLVEPYPAPQPVSIAQAGASAPSTLGRVGDVVTSAVGTVGAAGIWTLSQASSLLPRL